MIRKVPATVKTMAQVPCASTALAGVSNRGWMRQRPEGNSPSRTIAK